MRDWTNDETIEALAWAEMLRSMWAEVYVDDGGATLVDENLAARCFLLSVDCRAFELHILAITSDHFEAFLGWTPAGSGCLAYSVFGRGDFLQARAFLTWLKLRGPIIAEDLRHGTDVEQDGTSARWNDVAHLASFDLVRFESPPWECDAQMSIDDLPPHLRSGSASPSDFGTEIYDFAQPRAKGIVRTFTW